MVESVNSVDRLVSIYDLMCNIFYKLSSKVCVHNSPNETMYVHYLTLFTCDT